MSAIVTPTIAASVAAKAPNPAPKGFTGAQTNNLDTSFFHGMLYGETDSRKTTTAAAIIRGACGGSFKNAIAITAPNNTLVSRNAATIAIGATVIAQITIQYAPKENPPPSRQTRHWRQAMVTKPKPRRATANRIMQAASKTDSTAT